MTVLAALAFTAGRDPSSTSGQPPPPLTEAAIPTNPSTDAACAKIIEKLPVTLSSLAARRVFSASTNIVAWGDPAVVLRCGVARPASISAGSGDLFVGFGGTSAQTVYWLPQSAKKATTFTAVDRAVYVEVVAPAKYGGDSIMTPLSDAIAAALPAVCQASSGPVAVTVDPKSLCVNRP